MNEGTHSHSDFGDHADSLDLQLSLPLETLCSIYMSIILTDLSSLECHSGLAICCNNCNILVSRHQSCHLAFCFRAPSFPRLSVSHILWQPLQPPDLRDVGTAVPSHSHKFLWIVCLRPLGGSLILCWFFWPHTPVHLAHSLKSIFILNNLLILE